MTDILKASPEEASPSAFKRDIEEAAKGMSLEDAKALLAEELWINIKSRDPEACSVGFNTTRYNTEHGCLATLDIQTRGKNRHLVCASPHGGAERTIRSPELIVFSFWGDRDRGFVDALVELGERLKPLAVARARLRMEAGR